MGISGLLPLLKDIQNTKHLSEFAGQTIAVDAYVWLHRGTYACAPELVTGKKTHKYVDYAMHRVRLLQHHGIKPYIVFDGGPLPAKQGTESSRKQKREENLARATALAAQGKHSQARECYVKCIDVTPQMAYQLIKALRAENVPYVVAPYEADAQMAYLERAGLVDGILTEDSDLLVFGCQRVLLKLDAAAQTVTCIAREDFAAVSDAAGGISLLGWSDVQFRAMSILSGCDYLPSIPGVGLKTAWALLRKHRTAENVVRALTLEGKKKVPLGYMAAFRLAEAVFLHQRVYDPAQRRLVHLAPPPADDWDDAREAFVGSDLEPGLARRVAEGDACPVSLEPMADINPGFVPRALRALSTNTAAVRERRKGAEKPVAGGLAHFFTSKPAAAQESRSAPPGAAPPAVITAGRASGKRTLAEVMEQDVVAKRKKQEKPSVRAGKATASKFFVATPPPASLADDRSPAAGPSRVADKENWPLHAVEDGSREDPDPVQQEEGYVSPAPSLSRCGTPELSSPLRPGRVRGRSARRGGACSDDEDFGADVLSSPCVRQAGPARAPDVEKRPDAVGRLLVRNTPERAGGGSPGPDLRRAFADEEWEWDGRSSEIECSDGEGGCEASQSSRGSASGASSPGPVTPEVSGLARVAVCAGDGVEADELEDVMDAQAQNAVALGWWQRWARGGGERTFKPLRRRETTVTPDGRERPLHAQSAQPGLKRKGVWQQDLRAASRRSLMFNDEVKAAPNGGLLHDAGSSRPGSAEAPGADGAGVPAKNRLAEFRWLAGG